MQKNLRITPEGTRDLLFEECLARRKAESILSNLFQLRGYSEVMTPGIELYDLFDAGEPVIPAESMYKLTDSRGRLLVMRPDSTLPIARLTATRLKDAPFPVRLYYAQDVYHMNHGRSGHNDQQFQAGIELIGASGERADLEMLSLAVESLRICDVGDFRVEIGHVGFFLSLVGQLNVDDDVKDTIRTLIEDKNYAALGGVLDTLEPSDPVDFIRMLPRLFGGEEVLETAWALCSNTESHAALKYLSNLYKKLCALGLSDHVMIDLGMIHQNEYYTGVIFRGYIEGSGDTVISGGRYDTLLRRFGSDLPATGFGVNVDSLTKRMLERQAVDPPKPSEVLVHALPGYETEAFVKVGELAYQGMVCEFSVFNSLEEALVYAERRCISEVHAVSDTIKIYKL
ncbi:MAG TPA: ATP phosphoribosyltransferase regulatory subunit [Ruminococcaceae bacterium]|nr:ATP phosphoribosyltransferase regulatory subunit [Oscillospiraceae bacterium]